LLKGIDVYGLAGDAPAVLPTARRGGSLRSARLRIARRNTPSTPSRKNIPLYRNSELRHTSKQPGPTKRGGSRVVRNAGRVAVDAAASAREVRAGRVVPVSPRPRGDGRR
jgi:NADPH-dependent glutamate synthase beta subunit-like oxidoreductase